MKHKHGHNPFKNENITETNNEEIKENDAPEVSAEETEANVDNSDFDKLKEDFDKLNNQYLRLAADFDNYRKRQEAERENLLKFGTENALKKLIEVLDNFERGQKSLENVDDCQKVKDSFGLIHKQVVDTLSKLGMEEIKAEGEEFDPNFHNAILTGKDETKPEGIVLEEYQQGFKLRDRVIRHSVVKINKYWFFLMFSNKNIKFKYTN